MTKVAGCCLFLLFLTGCATSGSQPDQHQQGSFLQRYDVPSGSEKFFVGMFSSKSRKVDQTVYIVKCECIYVVAMDSYHRWVQAVLKEAGTSGFNDGLRKKANALWESGKTKRSVSTSYPASHIKVFFGNILSKNTPIEEVEGGVMITDQEDVLFFAEAAINAVAKLD